MAHIDELVRPEKTLISLFGAALDTTNLGVSALCYATVFNLFKLHDKLEVTVFDHGRGKRQATLIFPEKDIDIQLQGAFLSRRYYRSENIWVMRAAGLFGGLGNAGIHTIKNSTAVLDVSGGDSFSDIYGSPRFYHVTLPKLVVLQQKRPLILLPQTYGPFVSKKYRKIASEIIKKSTLAWARDKRSYEALKELAGNEFDPSRQKCGVDVAFGLPALKPSLIPEQIKIFLHNNTIGINVSGLLYNNHLKARTQFQLKADYKEIIIQLVTRFLRSTDYKILLIPHEIQEKSDPLACKKVFDTFSKENQKRLCIAPSYNSPCEVKWLISKLSWFCGTRMHATIAALSSGVPVSAISYSPKTLGVFETCGQGEHVADPRTMDTEEAVNILWSSWERRTEAKKELSIFLPQVFQQVDEQIKFIFEVIKEK